VKLTGERPVEGVTPDSLLALHRAGYDAIRARLGRGTVVDVGCGLGFETVNLAGDGRRLVGVDYDAETAALARRHWAARGLATVCADGSRAGIRTGAGDWVCSSHLIEHFVDPGVHAAELARLCADDGSCFVVTPNKPADFENPYHVALLDPDELRTLLTRYFDDVRVEGLDAVAKVKADFEARRATGNKILRFDVFDLRHRVPRRWYIAAYRLALKVMYGLLKNRYAGGTTGITADDFFVADHIDETTLVLFATCRQPRR
jgi:SAM-dependent methyltransferase